MKPDREYEEIEQEEREREERRISGLPDESGRGVEADIGAGVGLLAGAAAGAIAGPIGAMVGATIGSVVGELTGAAMHRTDALAAKHDHELDDAIGVTKGPLGAGAPITFVQPPTEAAFLRGDHALLDDLGDAVLTAIGGGDRDEIDDLMTNLDGRIREHLQREEETLLAGYALEAPFEAERIRAEHEDIRRALLVIELATDLHTLRVDAVKELLQKLRGHAAREDAGLYAWAERMKGAA